MTGRERFHRTLARQSVDRPPLWGEGIRDDVREAWAKEGVPLDRDLDAEFGIDRRDAIQPDIGSNRDRIVPTDAPQSAPDDPSRYPDDWRSLVMEYRERDFPVGLRIWRGLFLTTGVEDWRTLEPVLCALVDEPDRVAELMTAQARFAARVLERAYDEVEFDYALISEPIASNAAPVVGPWSLRSSSWAAYRLLLEQARSHGVRWAIFQSYGNATPLLPVAVEAGCNIYWPGDVRASGTSVKALRGLLGPAVGIVGGLDTGMLERSPAEIVRTVRRIVPTLLRTGGWLPLLDARVRAHVSFGRYAVYRRALVETVATACRESGPAATPIEGGLGP